MVKRESLMKAIRASTLFWSLIAVIAAQEAICAATRFLDDNVSQTITDTKTGLMWTKDAAPTVSGSSGCAENAVAPGGADAFVGCLNRNKYAGHSDWIVPTLQQVASLCNEAGDTTWLNDVLGKEVVGRCNKTKVDLGSWLTKEGFTNVQSDKPYWTSTHYSVSGNGYSATAISAVWAAVMTDDGGVFVVGKPGKFAVWPVRTAK
jgi:hypothetical protein